jgi:hypothetical protein
MDNQKESKDEPKEEAPKKFNRDTNIINVSGKKSFSVYVFIAKKYLEDFDTIELHSLG